MDPPIDLQEPDEARPAKRVRLDAPLGITEDVQDEVLDDEGWDDIYGDAPSPPTEHDGGVPIAPELAQITSSAIEEKDTEGVMEDGIPEEAIDNVGDELVAEDGYGASTDGPSARMVEETSRVETGQPHRGEDLETTRMDRGEEEHLYIHGAEGIQEDRNSVDPPLNEGSKPPAIDTEYECDPSPKPKPAEDAEFLAVAAVQKDNKEVEWQFNSSDAESSSGSDTDSSSGNSSDASESDSEGGYEMLDPATAAKILMSGDGDDEDGGKKNNTGDHQPRTTNEVKEAAVPKPNVVITEDMKITYLGTVDRTVETLVLIKAVTPGEFQVLESGSVLCNEKREVLGAVAETLGRVQQPMYSVAFNSVKDIEDAGLEFGAKIFYVDSHSSFVFTQPLKNLKGTDASNIHDEEIGEDEIEFSDDEAEAEYKKQKKMAKRGGRGGLSRTAFTQERTARSFRAPDHDSGQIISYGDAPQQQYGGGMSYDDGDVQEEFYSPLKRPENLSQLMASGGGPPRPQFGHLNRGRDRGRGDRGRGRGDRGRGRGGGLDRGNKRGGRGGFVQNDNRRGGLDQHTGHRGVAHSFPDRHNSDRSNGHKQHSLPPKPNASHSSPPPPQHQYPTYQQQTPPASNQQSYQFNGYTFQYGNPPQQPPVPQPGYYSHQQSPQSPTGSFPMGAYVNTAFFQNQQQQTPWSQPPSHQQPAYGWPPPVQAQQYQYGQPSPQQQQQQQQQSNLADIMRQFGGHQR